MKLSTNTRISLVLLGIIIAYFALEYYHNKKDTNELNHKFIHEDCMITMVGYDLGINKEIFDKLYPRIPDSIKYNKTNGYIDDGKIIKTFNGINVKQTQFCFADNVFSGTFTKTSVFTGIGLNLTNVTYEDACKLKTIFTKNDWRCDGDFNKDGNQEPSYLCNDINNCVGITLIYEPSKNKAYVGINIKDEIIYQQ